MARVTVEDCLERIPNRFAMALLASKRSRDSENKPCVTALREIAAGTVHWDVPVEDILSGNISEAKKRSHRARKAQAHQS